MLLYVHMCSFCSTPAVMCIYQFKSMNLWYDSHSLNTLTVLWNGSSVLLFSSNLFSFFFLVFEFVCYVYYLSYTFKSIGLLRRAMTHASFSEENNKALSILGGSVIETTVSFQLLSKDIDVSAKELNRRISQVANVESSCAVDGMRLGLHKVVRVSPKTNSSAPSVVCGAFRAIFGAIAIDTGKSDAAGSVFWNLHGGELGNALAM